MCAWVSNTASTDAGGNGASAQLRSRSSRGPWKRPQSINTRRWWFSIRYFEPVTVPAAPQKVMLAKDVLRSARYAHLFVTPDMRSNRLAKSKKDQERGNQQCEVAKRSGYSELAGNNSAEAATFQ